VHAMGCSCAITVTTCSRALPYGIVEPWLDSLSSIMAYNARESISPVNALSSSFSSNSLVPSQPLERTTNSRELDLSSLMNHS
jgi:hypothetical protein